MKKILLFLVLNLTLTSFMPALAAIKLPPGRLPETRPLQPAPEDDFPQYLESIQPQPMAAPANDSEGEQRGPGSDRPDNATNQNNQSPSVDSSSSPQSTRSIFWIILVSALLAGGALASFQIEKKKDQ